MFAVRLLTIKNSTISAENKEYIRRYMSESSNTKRYVLKR